MRDLRRCASATEPRASFQLDVFGEVAAALARMPAAEDDIRVSAADLQASLVNHLCEVWEQPDQGIWEVRGGARHFTHSKVMAWVAVDRAIELIESDQSFKGSKEEVKKRRDDLRRWKKVRATIHKEVCEKGLRQEAEQLCAVLWVEGARCLLPPDRAGGFSAG